MADFKAKGKTFRKRARNDSDEDEGGAASAVVRPVDKTKALNTFGTARTKNRDDAGKELLNDVSAYASSGSAAPHQYGGGAFATSEIDTAADRDGRALLEKNLQLQAQDHASRDAVEAGADGKKIYRGMAGYTGYHEKNVAEAVSRSKVSGTMGPLRAPTNVRGIVRVDYQPDVCKDYKETGFCGFGDSCKFLHDRGDYKAGWQLDQEWDAQQKKKQERLAARLAAGLPADEDDGDEEEDYTIKDEDEELPFACHLCREPFVNPIQTQCGHYFCEKCAVTRHRTNPYCAICGKNTAGIFNAAPKLLAKIRERQVADAAAEAAAAGVGEDEHVKVPARGPSGAGAGSSSGGGWGAAADDADGDGDKTPEHYDHYDGAGGSGDEGEGQSKGQGAAKGKAIAGKGEGQDASGGDSDDAGGWS